MDHRFRQQRLPVRPLKNLTTQRGPARWRGLRLLTKCGCRGLRPLPGFGAEPQSLMPQHFLRALRAPERRKKRGSFQNQGFFNGLSPRRRADRAGIQALARRVRGTKPASGAAAPAAVEEATPADAPVSAESTAVPAAVAVAATAAPVVTAAVEGAESVPTSEPAPAADPDSIEARLARAEEELRLLREEREARENVLTQPAVPPAPKKRRHRRFPLFSSRF